MFKTITSFRRIFFLFLFGSTVLLVQSCAIVRGGEVGVKQRLGRVLPVTLGPGAYGINPFTTRVIRIPTRTVNLAMSLSLPAQEGVSISTTVSILYRIHPDSARSVYMNIGRNYEENLIINVFRSAASDVTAQYMAKDMHSGKRAEIEEEIAELMNKYVGDRGFVIESVLLKSIELPNGLSNSIEMKLQAEQDAQRMVFELQQAEAQAERQRIEAEGTRRANEILDEGLTPAILKWRSLEVFEQLSASPNAKVIITNGNDTPLIMDTDEE